MELLFDLKKNLSIDEVLLRIPDLDYNERENHDVQIFNKDILDKTELFNSLFLNFQNKSLKSVIYRTNSLQDSEIQDYFINILQQLSIIYDHEIINYPNYCMIDVDKLSTKSYSKILKLENKEEYFVLTAYYNFELKNYYIQLEQVLDQNYNAQEINSNTMAADINDINDIDDEELDEEIDDIILDDNSTNQEEENDSKEIEAEEEIDSEYKKRRKIAQKSVMGITVWLAIAMIISLVVIVYFSFNPYKLATKTHDSMNIIYYWISFIFYFCTIVLIPVSVLWNFYEFKKYINNPQDIFNTPTIKYRKFSKIITDLLYSYKSTFLNFTDNESKKRTRANADLYFNSETIVTNLVPRFPLWNMMKLAGGSFIGFGILGTFMGFAKAMQNLNLESSAQMMEGIKVLVNQGLTTAFNTSIVGVICSLIYNFLIYSPLLQKMDLFFEKLCDDLDRQYYITETDALMMATMTQDENGEDITFSGSLNYILSNMNKQTAAFENFSNELADKIANVQSVVKQQMDQFTGKLSSGVTERLMEGVENEIGGLKDAILKATSELNAASASIGDTVDKINNETSDVLQEFNNVLNKSLTDCRDALGVIENVPDKLKAITESLDVAGSKMATSSETICDNMNTVSSEISDIAENIDQLMQSANNLVEQTSNNEQTSGQNLTNIVEQTNKILVDFNEINVQISNIFNSIATKINDYNKTSSDVLANYLTNFADSTKSYSSTVQSTISELGSALQEVNVTLDGINKSSNNFERSVKHLESAIKKQQ